MNLKTRSILASVILTLGLFLISSFDLYSGIINCGELPCSANICDCTEWSDWEIKDDIIMLPEFPGCLIKVSVCFRQCKSNPKCVENNVNSFSFVNPEECNAVKDYINNGDPNEKPLRLKHLYYELFREVSLMWFNQYCNTLQQNNQEYLWPWCNAVPSDNRVKITTYPGSCQATCITQYPDSDPTNPYLVTYIRCTDICCTHTLTLCKNLDGSTNMSETVDGQTTICEGSAPQKPCPPGQNTDFIPCTSYCGE